MPESDAPESAPAAAAAGRLRASVLAAVELGWWWAAAIGVWTLTLSSVTGPELVTATACGLPCALAARAGRKAVAGSWRPKPGWAAWLLAVIAAVFLDTVRLALLTMRGRAVDADPCLDRVRLPAEPPHVAAARHAAAILAISATPGTVVVDSDPKEGTLVIHTLVSGWPQVEQVVRR